MSRSVIGFVGAGLLGAIVVAGVYYWRPHRARPDAQSGLGIGLLTGAVVAFAVLAVQLLFDWRVASIEDRRRDEQAAQEAALRQQSERENLQLTVGLRRVLSDIDLRGRNLSGFYLGGKIMRRAQLGGANLDRAVLAGADLREAELSDTSLRAVTFARADMRGASFIGANLREATFEQARLDDAEFAQAVLRSADLSLARGGATADFSQATYDRGTQWPAGVTISDCEQTSCRAP